MCLDFFFIHDSGTVKMALYGTGQSSWLRERLEVESIVDGVGTRVLDLESGLEGGVRTAAWAATSRHPLG